MPQMLTQTIEEKIQQRRLQVLVHSYIYYELNDSIVSDDTWIRWARELVQLQQDNPKIASTVIYADQFKGFDGSTGAFFMFDDKIRSTALKLLEMAIDRVVVKQPKVQTVRKRKLKTKKFTGRKLF